MGIYAARGTLRFGHVGRGISDRFLSHTAFNFYWNSFLYIHASPTSLAPWATCHMNIVNQMLEMMLAQEMLGLLLLDTTSLPPSYLSCTPCLSPDRTPAPAVHQGLPDALPLCNNSVSHKSITRSNTTGLQRRTTAISLSFSIPQPR